jgi:hypothetical protein
LAADGDAGECVALASPEPVCEPDFGGEQREQQEGEVVDGEEECEGDRAAECAEEQLIFVSAG